MVVKFQRKTFFTKFLQSRYIYMVIESFNNLQGCGMNGAAASTPASQSRFNHFRKSALRGRNAVIKGQHLQFWAQTYRRRIIRVLMGKNGEEIVRGDDGSPRLNGELHKGGISALKAFDEFQFGNRCIVNVKPLESAAGTTEKG